MGRGERPGDGAGLFGGEIVGNSGGGSDGRGSSFGGEAIDDRPAGAERREGVVDGGGDLGGRGDGDVGGTTGF